MNISDEDLEALLAVKTHSLIVPEESELLLHELGIELKFYIS